MGDKPKACGVLLVRGMPLQEFLLMEHADRLDLPKGHLEPGETELACALREMEEETGVPRSAVALDPTFRFETRYQVRSRREPRQWVWKTTVIFLARFVGQEFPITVSEHQGFRWFPWHPPHQIQARTIDPLLAAVEHHLARE